jgi:2-C-methyl-D-erythritol 4-phosphate cytidylyltransferase
MTVLVNDSADAVSLSRGAASSAVAAAPAGAADVLSSAVAAIVPAAGSGVRLGAGRSKALVELGGAPLLTWSLLALIAGGVGHLVVAVPTDDEQAARLREAVCLVLPDALVTFVTGGVDRTGSVRAALAVLSPQVDTVLVHDAARPLVPAELVARVLAAVRGGHEAVVPGLPVVDTVKQVEADRVTATLDRELLVAVQTPQGFRRDTLDRAYAAAAGPATDDAGLVERLGIPVHVVPGDPAAFKITRPLDLVLARAVLAGRLGEPATEPV